MRTKRCRRRSSGSTRPREMRAALAERAMSQRDACAHPRTGGAIGSARWPTTAPLGYSMLPTPRRCCFATRTSYPAVSNAASPGTEAKPATRSRRRTPTLQSALSSSTGSLVLAALRTRQPSHSKSFRAHAMYIASLAGSAIARRHCLPTCPPHWLGACFAATLLGE